MNASDDRARFQQVVMPHLDAAYNLARWLTGNNHDAEDVAQEACLRAFRFFDGFRGEDARTWLLRIVRNTYYSEWRRARSRDESTQFDDEVHSAVDDEGIVPSMSHAQPNPEAAFVRGEQIRLLDQALEELPVEYREALVLREIEDLSYKQIASALEVPIGTVMSRIARGRRLLLESFKRLAGDNHEMRRSENSAGRLR